MKALLSCYHEIGKPIVSVPELTSAQKNVYRNAASSNDNHLNIKLVFTVLEIDFNA